MAKGRPKKPVDIERGRRLKECIDLAGLTVTEFHRRLFDECADGTRIPLLQTEGSIRNIISGQRNLTDEVAKRAAEILGVRPAYLLNLDDYRTQAEIESHPAFPFVTALVNAGKRNKALELYLSSFHLSIVLNEDLGERFGLEHIEQFLESENAYTIIDSDGNKVGNCSEAERTAFISEIDSFIEYSINKLIGGRFKNG